MVYSGLQCYAESTARDTSTGEKSNCTRDRQV